MDKKPSVTEDTLKACYAATELNTDANIGCQEGQGVLDNEGQHGIQEEENGDMSQQQQEDKKIVSFGVLVIGPSGSGKSTLCDGLQQFMEGVKRKVCVVNLDPANDQPKYRADIDISDLVCLQDVMENFQLGPNGGLIYCMEFLADNFTWLKTKMTPFKDHYFVIDFPGQLELFLNSDCIRTLIQNLRSKVADGNESETNGIAFEEEEGLNMRLTAVELFDAQYIMDKTKYMSACIYSLMTMINLSIPHLNVLSKVDLLGTFGALDFKIDSYIDGNNFDALAESFEREDSKFTRKYSKLTKNICELLGNYGMTDFFPLDVCDQVNVSNLISKIDKCNGFSISSSGEEENKDLRERLFEAQELHKNNHTLTKFQQNVEMQEEDLMQRQIRLFESFAKGEITEDEMYAMMDQLGQQEG